MTLSYVFGLVPEVLSVLAKDPIFDQIGSPLKSPIDMNQMLRAAPRLSTDYECRDVLPGFEDFCEEKMLDRPGLLLDRVGSYGDVRCLPETDALGLRWAELGIHLIKC